MLRIVFYSAFSDKRIIGAPPTPTPLIFAKIIYMKGLT